MNLFSRFPDQRGIVLPMAMLFSAVMVTLVASALRVATLQSRMAGNVASRLFAFELAESVIVEILQEPGRFTLREAPGVLRCPEDLSKSVCTPLNFDSDQVGVYSVSRIAPLWWRDFTLRESEAQVTGIGHFNTAIFEVAVTIGAQHGRSATAHVIQGVAVRVPAGHE